MTSLQPSLLLEGLGGAVDLLQGDAGALLDLMEVRRLLEPVATALAATRISDEGLAEAKRHLDAMREARDDVEQLNAHDAAFHRAVVAATGNESLVTLLEGVSGRTLRARIWRGLVDGQAAGRTLAEHEAIFAALSRRDAALSQAAALLHVSNTEQWLRDHLEGTPVASETPVTTGGEGAGRSDALPLGDEYRTGRTGPRRAVSPIRPAAVPARLAATTANARTRPRAPGHGTGVRAALRAEVGVPGPRVGIR